MRKTVIAKDEYRQKPETRTYEITGKAYQLDALEKFLKTVEYLGAIGASRSLQLSVDGDGAARLTIKKDGKDLPKVEVDIDKEPVKFGID